MMPDILNLVTTLWVCWQLRRKRTFGQLRVRGTGISSHFRKLFNKPYIKNRQTAVCPALLFTVDLQSQCLPPWHHNPSSSDDGQENMSRRNRSYEQTCCPCPYLDALLSAGGLIVGLSKRNRVRRVRAEELGERSARETEKQEHDWQHKTLGLSEREEQK